MKLTYKVISIIFVLLILQLILFNNTPKIITKPVITKSLKLINWEKLIWSIIFIESNNDDDAKNVGNCIGCLQITPIYVKEVNKILKSKHSNQVYTVSDRYDREKSIEMFEIFQNHKNPNRDFHMAIKLHNPTASKSYENKIMELYRKLN